MAGVNGEGVEVRIQHAEMYPDRPWRSVYVRDTGVGQENAGAADHRDDGTCTSKRLDLIELVTDEQGFTIWRGGERPVPVDAKVTVRFDDGHISQPGFAGNYSWAKNPGHGLLQIIGYKVVELAQQPAPSTPDSASLAEETLSALGWVFDGTTWVEQQTPTARLPEWDGVGRIEMIPGGIPVMAVPGYELLSDVLHRAYNQAAIGKGKERHANGEPFDEQVMQDGARRFGVGALLFQAFKKSEESQRLPLDRGVNELLGAIVYLAGAVIRREADAAEGGA